MSMVEGQYTSNVYGAIKEGRYDEAYMHYSEAIRAAKKAVPRPAAT